LNGHNGATPRNRQKIVRGMPGMARGGRKPGQSIQFLPNGKILTFDAATQHKIMTLTRQNAIPRILATVSTCFIAYLPYYQARVFCYFLTISGVNTDSVSTYQIKNAALQCT
jgi:hypothetical protein